MSSHQIINDKKNAIRALSKEKIKDISTEIDRATLSKNATNFLISSDLYKSAECIFLFISKKNEIDTSYLLKQAFHDNKDIAIPRVSGENMNFYYLQKNIELEQQLEQGAFGIKEPSESLQIISADRLPVNSIFVLPGLAFSKEGARIGYGKGFYDRYLNTVFNTNKPIYLPKALIGFCYQCQIFETLPSDDFDIPLTHLASESGIYIC